MDRKSKQEDIEARSLAYRQGRVRLEHALGGFRDLTGVDLADCVDVSGRHMGEAPYLKITTERLAELATELDDAMNGRATRALKAVEEIHRASPVAVLSNYRSIASGPVLSAYRPVPS